MAISLSEIETWIRAAQLEPRGAFYCTPEDQIPVLSEGIPARTVVLIGTIGSRFWPAFLDARLSLGDDPNPLDAYSNRIISNLAEEFKASAVFPFGGPPWHPFQRWAQRAEAVYQSPIGPLIHPQYGLWHAYRGALIFAEEISGVNTTRVDPAPSPCESCEDKPCLNTCPVAAFSPSGYAVPTCIEHLQAAAGENCMRTGCLARQACPVGVEYLYQPDHAQFHMAAFVKSHS
jgi:hypothetical protein